MYSVDGIVLGTYRGDIWAAKICVASIRYWYPEIPIFIYKDLYSGEYDTRELEECWGVQVLDLGRDRFGSPWSKIFVNFVEGGKRFLVLDSDCVFVGHVLSQFNGVESDFVVSREAGVNPETDWFRRTYYDLSRLRRLDPDFRFPGYSFNGGQLLVTTGKLQLSDFEPFVDLEGRLSTLDPETFPVLEQSVYNYLLPRKAQRGEITLTAREFMLWGTENRLRDVSLEDIAVKKGKPYLVHWAGTLNPLLRNTDRGDLLGFFQDYYFSRVPLGTPKRWRSSIWRELRWGWPRSIYRRLRS